MRRTVEDKCAKVTEPQSQYQKKAQPVFEKVVQKGLEKFPELDVDNSGGVGPKDMEDKFRAALMPQKEELLKLRHKELDDALLNTLKSSPDLKLVSQLALSLRIAGLDKRRGQLGYDVSVGAKPKSNIMEKDREVSYADLHHLSQANMVSRYVCTMDNYYPVDHEWMFRVNEPDFIFKQKIKEVKEGLLLADTLLKVMDIIGKKESITSADIHQMVIRAKSPATRNLMVQEMDRLLESDGPVTKKDVEKMLTMGEKTKGGAAPRYEKITPEDWDVITTLADHAYVLAYLDPQQKLPVDRRLVFRQKSYQVKYDGDKRYAEEVRINGKPIGSNDIIITRAAIDKFKEELIQNPWNMSRESQTSDAGVARTRLIQVYRNVYNPPRLPKMPGGAADGRYNPRFNF